MAVLRVHVMSGPHYEEVASRLQWHDRVGLLSVSEVDCPGIAAMVIAVTDGCIDERVADVILDAGYALAAQIDGLWIERLEPFARRTAGIARDEPGPPVLHDHDPRLLVAAQRMLNRIREGLTRCGLDDGSWSYDHIGATAVPGLRAKRLIDLQIGAARCLRKARLRMGCWQQLDSCQLWAPGPTHRVFTATR